MAVFAAAAQMPLTVSPAWLWAAALAWAVLAACRASLAAARGHWRSLAPLAGWAALFAILPPLAAFTLYFIGAHAPAHMRAIIRHPTRAPRVHSLPSAIRRSLPLTAVTIAIGAALWPFYHGALEVHAVGLTLQLLSALTLPHMLLDAAMARHERRPPGQVTASTLGVMLPYRPSRAV